MSRPRRPSTPKQAAKPAQPDAWLTAVANSASAATGAPAELLGEYLALLADAALRGRRARPVELAAVRDLGRRAAEQGVGVDQATELYLSAAWRLWRELPARAQSRDQGRVRTAAEAVLRVIDSAVSALVQGHQSARRDLIRHEEFLRGEFVDDLLRGDADVAGLVERAEPFGLDLGRPHLVALARPRGNDRELDRAAIILERAIVDRFGDRDVLVATKDGRVVVLVPAPVTPTEPRPAEDVTDLIRIELGRLASGHPWRIVSGRSYPGAYGIARSYEQAREALTLAERLGLSTDVVHARDLLVFRVLARDQAAIVDLVRDLLGPLARARGGPETLLRTLQAYFDAAETATETARALHLSVRTITYRLAKVKELTGYDTADPGERFALHAAVLGARLLDWPAHPLPPIT